ncbi:MAG: TraR/DksA family transcriptional regulator [Persicimonas sp.]
MSEPSQEFIDEMREQLERQRAELINKSHLAQNDIRDNKARQQGVGDSLDESTREQGTSTRLRLADRDRNLLMKINRTLERIDDGEYGYCVECGEPIAEKRLRARPVTDRCIECKEDQERREAQTKARPGLMDDFE